MELRVVAVVVLAGLLAGCAGLRQSLQNQPCALAPDRPYDVVEVDPDRHEIRLYWRDASGAPFLTLETVRAHVAAQGDRLVAATNAGIYEPGYVPTGLLVEDGIERVPLNLADGAGNFYLKPNGVFYVTEGGAARIAAAEAFGAMDEAVRYATQSGPLLVRDGEIHPAFTPGSANCRLRSGVGVAPDGRVFLALSNGAVSFYDFATYFRDTLGTPNALYLDGAISALYAPTLGRFDTGQRYAAFLVVVER